ncbi:MAG: hypothetical protein Q4A79_01050 [Candidatus Saccharibacteria bacterium]|nr:hypothetical protein [Candidatus Saccharibacteria bacterium]
MVFDVSKINDIGEFSTKTEENRTLYLKDDKVFLVIYPNTIEIRTDEKLKELLCKKYESVMESRYFGRGGIEIVLVGQLSEPELLDLIRLSFNLTTNLK